MIRRLTLAITGASGSGYALCLLKALLQQQIEVYLLISDAAREVFRLEAGLLLPQDDQQLTNCLLEQLGLSHQVNLPSLRYFSQFDWLAPVASGSNVPDAMVICPCSMGTLAAVSYGMSNNLIERAADVMLKEQKPLLIVPREMPVSTIHLENMLKLSKMGVCILPACPGFYHQPQGIDDIIAFVVARILDQLKIPQKMIKPWSEP